MNDSELAAVLQRHLGPAFTGVRLIGAGGGGRAYRVDDNRTLDRNGTPRRLVAKVVAEEQLDLARFEREIGLVAQFNHPHIVPLIDRGACAGHRYFLMPYYAAGPLSEFPTPKNRNELSQAIRMLRDVADAVAYAHVEGIVHRDIKPENIFLEGRHAWLGDFGIARHIESNERSDRLTDTGKIVGSWQYMAPEQFGDAHDAAVDVYAFGAVAYRTLVGKRPFARCQKLQEIMAAHMRGDAPEDIRGQRKDIPERLSAMVMSCLAKEPCQRPDMNQVLAVLNGLIGDERPTRGTLRLRVRREMKRTMPMPLSVIGILAAVIAGFALSWPNDGQEVGFPAKGSPVARRGPATLPGGDAPTGAEATPIIPRPPLTRIRGGPNGATPADTAPTLRGSPRTLDTFPIVPAAFIRPVEEALALVAVYLRDKDIDCAAAHAWLDSSRIRFEALPSKYQHGIQWQQIRDTTSRHVDRYQVLCVKPSTE